MAELLLERGSRGRGLSRDSITHPYHVLQSRWQIYKTSIKYANKATNKKGGKLIQLPTFFIIKFILQDCEVGCLDNLDLTFVLLFPFSYNRGEDSSCQVGAQERIDLKDQISDLLFIHIV